MKQIKDFDRFLNEAFLGDSLDEKAAKTYTEEQLKSAMKFCIEKFTNYIEAMSHQETEKAFKEWTKSKTKEYYGE